jgi:hypothetical protein
MEKLQGRAAHFIKICVFKHVTSEDPNIMGFLHRVDLKIKIPTFGFGHCLHLQGQHPRRYESSPTEL